ncbi:RTA1 like protein-domain-containing protein [Microdochium bolleyi]|uniref:RTA1 like protein-domain-containing protein n=1 Tax=Microdochium bolleyi TaxID=196109 RepID=A0A136INN9_9PEZI|nr:RTA1 like protein-domain-containing protein [Microdochium bolleyi]
MICTTLISLLALALGTSALPNGARREQQATPTTTIVLPRDTITIPSTAAPTPPPATTPTGTFYITSYITITGFTSPHATLPDKTIELVLPTCIQTIAPDPSDGYILPGECGALYNYRPSSAAAMVATVVFGLLTAAHVWLGFVQHRKGWTWVLVMACLWEFLGFASRVASTRAQNVVGLYLVMQIFILLAPLWINAFAYIVLGRLIHAYLPGHALLGIPAYVFSAVFVTLDVAAFVVQLVGGTMAGPTAPPEELAHAIHIYMGGIALQQFFIVVFVSLAARFQVEAARQRDDEKMGVKHLSLDTPGGSSSSSSSSISAGYLSSWRALLAALYFVLAMITLRIVYRLVEMSSGDPDNSLTRSETYLYVLEALPMALALLAFAVVHPARALSGPEADGMPGLFGVVWRKMKCCGRGGRGTQKDAEGRMLPPGVAFGGAAEMGHVKRRGTYERIGEAEAGRRV